MPYATDLAALPELQNRNHTERKPVTFRASWAVPVYPWVITTAKQAGATAGFAHRIGEQRARGNP